MAPKGMKRPAAAPVLGPAAGTRGSSSAKRTAFTAPSPLPPRSFLSSPSPVHRAPGFDKKSHSMECENIQFKERAAQLQARAERAEAELKAVQRMQAEAESRAVRAESRLEVLSVQATAATEALDRAARAEERAAVLGDLQGKLPLLIRAVIGSVQCGGMPMAPCGLPMTPGPVKLELENNTGSAVRDPYCTSVHSNHSSVASTQEAMRGKTPGSDPAREAQADRQASSLVQRAMGAMSSMSSTRRSMRP